jgi:hypothetical protein
MIEEYARHNGHADLLRERIDGATGELPAGLNHRAAATVSRAGGGWDGLACKTGGCRPAPSRMCG